MPRPTPSVDASAARSPAQAVFRKDGEYWTVGWQDRPLRLKDTKGFAYLAHLLRHPTTEFHALDLVGGIAATGTTRRPVGPMQTSTRRGSTSQRRTTRARCWTTARGWRTSAGSRSCARSWTPPRRPGGSGPPRRPSGRSRSSPPSCRARSACTAGAGAPRPRPSARGRVSRIRPGPRARPGGPGGADRLDRTRPRRDGHGQGADRTGHPQPERPARPCLRQDQLRRHPVGASRERALRPRARGVHRCCRAEDRTIRRGERRHPLPRRGRRDPARATAEAPPGSPRSGVRAHRRNSDDQSRRPSGGGDEPRPRPDDRRARLP